MRPTPDQWGAWKAHPCSEWFFGALQAEFQNLTEDFILGGTVSTGSVDETALATTSRQATTKTLYMVGQANYEDVCEMLGIELPIEEEE